MAVDYLGMVNRKERVPIFTDIDTLDVYCTYLLNDASKHINYANLTNLKEFIDTFDPKVMITNDDKMARYEFVRTYLEAKLEHGITSRKLCLNYVDANMERRYQNIIHREVLACTEPDSLCKKDIEFINQMIFRKLNYSFLHNYKLAMMKMLSDLDSEEFGKTDDDCNSAIQLFQTITTDLTKAKRRSKQDNRFNLTDEQNFKATMQEAMERLLSESQYLQTHWQGLNKMLNGGFENSRVYNFIGATGGFKSGLLLNIMKGIKIMNKGKPHKDPTKRPTILFISQENNMWETIQRLFGIFGSVQNIKNFTAEEIMELMQRGGFKVVQDDLDIDIEFRYYGNGDIGIPDIRGICEELDNAGREVICIIQDYIERLRPPLMNVERRTQLFDISNQMHELAMELEVPIITGSQFNRDGVATIEEMQAKGKADIGKQVSSKNVSESFGMLKNIDVNIGIVIEYDSEEERYYLSFNKHKFRGADDTALSFFLQPFMGTKSKIQLMEDMDEDRPVFRKSLQDEAAATIADCSRTMEKITRKTTTFIEPITKLEEEDTANFLNGLMARSSQNHKVDVVTKDDLYRDSDGFMVLMPKRPDIFAMYERAPA